MSVTLPTPSALMHDEVPRIAGRLQLQHVCIWQVLQVELHV